MENDESQTYSATLFMLALYLPLSLKLENVMQFQQDHAVLVFGINWRGA